MPDREKVVKGLECCTKRVCIYKDTKKECPYWELCGEYEDAFEDCTTALAKDAIALLKAQEPCEDAVSRKDVINVLQSPCDMRYVNGNWHPCIGDYIEAITNLSAVAPKAQEPVEPVFDRQFMSNIELYDCGKCGTSLGAKGIAKYCMKCGQAVKWDG